MRTMSPTPTASSWRSLKELAQQAFRQGNYEASLSKYGAALNPALECPPSERQMILSNVVACRLKIGGTAQAKAAVQTAKQCIGINHQWAKGHVRLASAYIALGGHSNDACNALQRALQLDPGNPAARDMLVRELRRDLHTPQQQPIAPSPQVQDESLYPTAPPQDQDDRIHDDSRRRRTNDYLGLDDPPPTPPSPERTWKEDLQIYSIKVQNWYLGQSEDTQTFLKVGVMIVILYLAFGGRFGLLGQGEQRRGNYQSGNVYDQYRQRQVGAHSQSSNRYSSYEYSQHPPSSSWSLHMPNLFDGSSLSMFLLLAIGYICHRNGINPTQALFMLQMMGGGGGRHRRYRRGMFGGGFGRRRRW